MQTFSSLAQRRLDILSPFGDERPHSQVLKASWLETPLGEMLAIADDKALFFLEFVDWKGLERAVAKLCTQALATVVSGRTLPIQSIEQELKAYFEGRLKDFETPLQLCGTPFQKQVWKVLRQVPYGETQSYTGQAITAGNPLAFRAVANANARNPIALVIPCHRIINRNGQLGGYGGGIDRKKWLCSMKSKTKNFLRFSEKKMKRLQQAHLCFLCRYLEGRREVIVGLRGGEGGGVYFCKTLGFKAGGLGGGLFGGGVGAEVFVPVA